MRRLITSNIDDTENDDDENITEEDDIDVEIKEEEREIVRANTKTQFANFSGENFLHQIHLIYLSTNLS